MTTQSHLQTGIKSTSDTLCMSDILERVGSALEVLYSPAGDDVAVVAVAEGTACVVA
jgi:hypothetical protein